MKLSLAIIAWLGLLVQYGSSDPTWPATTDELEDFMYVTSGYGSSGFAANVIPCTASHTGGLDRQTSAEWIRLAFHDMSTTNIYYANVGGPHGGIDASMMYELNSGENIGAGFNSSLATYGEFFSKRTSVSDLIALGLSAATRSCGGPVVPVKTGRIDATAAGPIGVPQPQNSLFTFESQFQRMGFTTSEMILMTACGHTVGGVHAGNFPNIVTVGSVANDYAHFDDTVDVFDDHIATQYLGGTTIDPLSTGPCVQSTRCSDKVTFNGDSNATVATINTPTSFSSACQSILQRMIEVVPPTVTLGDALAPYTVKPYSLQLTLLAGGASIKFTGNIRVRTTTGSVGSVQLSYLDRTGATGGTITTTVAGTAAGFDDTFTFYGFSATLDSTKSISSFTVVVTYTTGGVTTYDNNGAGYPIQDSIMMLAPQSCLNQASGNLTVVAAVRNTVTTVPTLDLSLKTPQYTTNSVPVPVLSNSSLTMLKGSTVGPYSLYSATTTLSPAQLSNTQFDLSAGTAKDQFKSSADLGTTCAALGTSSSSSSSSIIPSTSTAKSTTSTSILAITSTSTSNSITTTSTSATTTTSAPTQTAPAIKVTIGAYSFMGCYTEGDGVRALSGNTFIDYTNMTLETCAKNCAAYTYWGVEYSGECYCGNSLGAGSVLAASADCSFLCPGNSLEYCGAGNRLEMYGLGGISSTSSSKSSNVISTTLKSSTTSSLSTTSSKPSSTSSSTSSKISPSTSTFSVSATSSKPSSTSSSTSSKVSSSSTTSKTSSFTSSSTSTTPTGPSQPAKIAGTWNLYGCLTEGTNARALAATAFAYDSMTLESCAANCTGSTYFGTEYGRECYCGNSFSSGAVTAPSTDCNMLCGGDQYEYCGAGNRLSVYVLGSSISVVSSTTKASSSSSSSTSVVSSSTTKASTSSTTKSSTSSTSSTISTSKTTTSSTTKALLLSTSKTTTSSTSSTKSSTLSTKLSSTTSSSSTKTTTSATPTGPTIVPTATPGFPYIGCYSEGTNSRALSSANYINYNNMSVEICTQFCKGFTYFGVEYGGECYCGFQLQSGSTKFPDTDCNQLCDGTPSEYCGAGNRLVVYSNVTQTTQ